MRLEDLPPVLGGLVALLGLWLLWDAIVPDRVPSPHRERRRRVRADRDRAGEAALGLGTLAMAAALLGRDVWRYGTVAVMVGAVLLLVGAALNFRFLRELLVFRGPARRQDDRAPRGAEADRYVDGASAAVGGSAPPPSPAAPPAAPPGTPPAVPPDDAGDRPLRIR